MSGSEYKLPWGLTIENQNAVANNCNRNDLMNYVADAPPKIIPPTHLDNSEIVNSGNTVHFLQATSVCMNRKLTHSPLLVTFPDGSQIQWTHTAMLSFLKSQEAARRIHIFTKLKSKALLSVSQPCNHGYKVNFS